MNCVILGSGKGSNARAILEASTQQFLGNTNIKAIFSDQPDAQILSIADSFAIPARHLSLDEDSAFISSDESKALFEIINEYSPDLIVLAGFMKILPVDFIDKFQGRIINIHPSLLPSFKGLNAIKRAFDHGVKITGCTVHMVTEKIDDGKIIAQAPVRVMETDSLESVTQKIHAAEHVLLPSVIAKISQEYIKLSQ